MGVWVNGWIRERKVDHLIHLFLYSFINIHEPSPNSLNFWDGWFTRVFFFFFIGSRYSICSFAKKSLKKSRRDVTEAAGDLLDDKFVQNDNLDTSLNPAAPNSNPLPSRSDVLQACIITCGLIAALGIVIRQVVFLLCITRPVSPFAALACSQLCCLS